MSGVRLEIKGLGHEYAGGVRALDGVDLTVEPGQIQVLLGPSGCGKTTLLRILAGLLQPTHGSVLIDGEDVTRVPTHRRGAVLVHQDQLLFPNMSVRDNVAYPLRARGIARKPARDEAEAALARVQLEGLGARKPHELSGGQRQRAALARALCARPRMLLLDEPLSALDAGLRDAMRTLILRVQRESELTVVAVTHDQREAASLADRVAVIMGGTVMQNDAPDTLYRTPSKAAVARFLGATNFFSAQIEGQRADTALGELKFTGTAPAGANEVCVWPQDVVLGDGINAVSATVKDVVFTGSERRVVLETAGGALEAVLPRWSAVEIGDKVEVRLPPERVVPVVSDGAHT